MKTYKELFQLIGNTPVIDITEYCGGEANVYAKLEMFNPLSSVKDRVALSMIEQAEQSGRLIPGSTIIEPTSGNTGIGLAFIAAAKGYPIILTMPETMSIERRKLLHALGAKIVLTKAADAMGGAVKKAEELAKEIPNSFIPQQFENTSNPEIHRKTTAREILDDLDGKVDIFVAGVGTGGTLTGVGEVVKEKNPDAKVIAVEPFQSSVLSGRGKALHRIQGIGAGFIPEILNMDIIDEIIRVEDDAAGDTARDIAKKKGLLIGISSGAALWATTVLAKRPENKGKNIVTLFPDSGERYLSTWLYEDFDIDENSPEVKAQEKSAEELAVYYFQNGFSCSEAVLRALNAKYELGLGDDGFRIASAMGGGMGESGCACGSVTGALVAFGLIAGRKRAYESNRMAALAAHELHQRFKTENKAVCCRILTKGMEWLSAEQKVKCEGYVRTSARIAQDIIENQLSELLAQKHNS